MAYQSPRDAVRAACTEVFLPRPERTPCVGAHRQHIGGRLYQPPRRSALTPLLQSGAPHPCVNPRETLSLREVYIPGHLNMGADVNMGADETGAEARRMDASPRCGVWPGSGGPLRYSGDSTMSPLVLWGLDAMLQMWPRLHLYVFSPIALLPGVLARV